MLHYFLRVFAAVLPNHVSVAAALSDRVTDGAEMVARALYCPQHIAM